MQDNVINLKTRTHNITPIFGLKTTASVIARSYQDKGAIIITSNENGDIRIGTDGLTSNELRECLCVAINYSFVFEEN